jgi:hypothetical protein
VSQSLLLRRTQLRAIANKRFKFARTARPTHKVQCTLFAA